MEKYIYEEIDPPERLINPTSTIYLHKYSLICPLKYSLHKFVSQLKIMCLITGLIYISNFSR